MTQEARADQRTPEDSGSCLRCCSGMMEDGRMVAEAKRSQRDLTREKRLELKNFGTGGSWHWGARSSPPERLFLFYASFVRDSLK